jgi:23S rRNA (guanine745-N1)-methyltransferase
VRACGEPLERRGAVFVCPRGHSYDVARSGYVNLLQPQDRRAKEPGDAKEAVAARSRLLAAGVGRALVDDLVRRLAALDLAAGEAAVDLGSGSGDALAALAAARPLTAIGIDLSAAAADHAARRFPGATWVVANADRRLPLVDAGAALLCSVHARRNPDECARVLRRGGYLIVAVPAGDDLVELREAVSGRRVERETADGVATEHAPHFTLVDRGIVRERHTLGRDALLDVLRSTYRGRRTSEAERVAALTTLDVTFASEVFVFGPPEGGRHGRLRAAGYGLRASLRAGL